MAGVFVGVGAVASTYGGSSCTATKASSVAGNHLRLKVVWSSPTSNAPPATPSGWLVGGSATGQAALTGGGYFTGCTTFYKENIAGGAVSALVDGTAGGWAIDAFIEEWSGLATSGSLDQVITGGAAGSNTSASLTTGSATTQASEVVDALFAGPGVNSSSNIGIQTPPASGYTADYVQQNNQTHAVGSGGYKIVSSTGVQSASVTWTQPGEWAGVLVTFKAAAGGGTNYTLTVAKANVPVTLQTVTFVDTPHVPTSYLLNIGTAIVPVSMSPTFTDYGLGVAVLAVPVALKALALVYTPSGGGASYVLPISVRAVPVALQPIGLIYTTPGGGGGNGGANTKTTLFIGIRI